MKKKNLFLFMLLLLSSYYDMDAQDVSPVKIPFETALNTTKELVLSQIAADVKIVPLETTENCLLSKVKAGAIQMIGHDIYIPCDMGLLQFSDDGKFVCSVSPKGQGPGEYANIRYVAVDRVQKQIHLLTNGKVLVFSSEGKSLREARFPMVWQLELLGQDTYVSYVYNGNGKKREKIVLSNMKGEQINTFPQYDQFTVPSGMTFYNTDPYDRYLYQFAGNTCLKEFYNDTVFTVKKDKLIPRYILDMGKYRLPDKYRFEVLDGNWERFNEVSAPYWRPNMVETTRSVFVPYSPWKFEDRIKGRKLVVYDKKGKSSYNVKGGYIKNDMNSRLPFYPNIQTTDDVVINLWEATDILELAKKDPALLEHKALQNLKEDDNPVLIVVTMKK